MLGIAWFLFFFSIVNVFTLTLSLQCSACAGLQLAVKKSATLIGTPAVEHSPGEVANREACGI